MSTGAKARFLLPGLRGAEAPLFHGCAGQMGSGRGFCRRTQTAGSSPASPVRNDKS